MKELVTVLAFAASAVFGLPAGSFAAHDDGRDVGGLELTDYCQAKGFERASFPEDVGKVGDWRCQERWIDYGVPAATGSG